MKGALDLDLSKGVSNVSVFAVPGVTRNTTRWLPMTYIKAYEPTLTVTKFGNTATFSGLGGVDQVAGLLIDGVPFIYRGQGGDTPSTVAAVLADTIQRVRPCWVSGPSIRVPTAIKMIARVAADA